jgi:CBS domain-containing protein
MAPQTLKDLTAKDLMTSNVLTVGEEWLLDRLAEFFIEHSISGAPVASEDGKLIGVVSLTDLARFQSLPVGEVREESPHQYFQPIEDLRLAREELSGFRVDIESLVTVGDIMTPAIFNVDEDAGVQQVADIMISGRIHRLLVTRDGEVTGIVAAFDLLRAISEYEFD